MACFRLPWDSDTMEIQKHYECSMQIEYATKFDHHTCCTNILIAMYCTSEVMPVFTSYVHIFLERTLEKKTAGALATEQQGDTNEDCF